MPDPRRLDNEEMTPSVETPPPESGDLRSFRVVDHDDRLIRWMLELTPAKRLEALQNFADGIAALWHAKKVTQ